MFISPKNNCSHIENSQIISAEEIQFFSFEKIICKNCLSAFSPLSICLICGEIYCTFTHLKNHINISNHNISIFLEDLSIYCNLCNDEKTEENGTFIQSKLLNKHIQFLFERKFKIPFFQIYSKEEIYKVKYNNFISLLKNNSFQKIIFMVGAGISTTAGIPDFRSKTGLFKQLQDKYNLNSPEEFFEISTFLDNPLFFYEFCKIFDLSKTKPTLTHKFISFLTNKKNCVKYIFTQNIDGLELKAKINPNKIIFAHGTFTKGHCPICKREINIEEINKCIEDNIIKYCDICNNPCKPNIVFYGERLPEEFFIKGNDIYDADLIIIMGTSLQVHPFASLPKVSNEKCWKVIFNMDKVGNYGYNLLSCNSLFLEGKTDKVVLNVIRDCGLENEFLEFIKDEFGDCDFGEGKEENMININNEISDINNNNNEKNNKDNSNSNNNSSSENYNSINNNNSEKYDNEINDINSNINLAYNILNSENNYGNISDNNDSDDVDIEKCFNREI